MFSNKKMAIFGLVISISSLVIFGLACSGEDSSTPTKTVDGKVVKLEVGKPDQIKFHSESKRISSKYSDAGNEMKKSKVYRELKSFILKHLRSGSFQNWEGEITNIGTTEGGSKAYISIEANFEGKDIEYKTWNNQLSDYSARSMLKIRSTVYKQVEELAEGDKVIFSGRFIRDRKKGFSESSMTESGTVRSPEYIIRFSKIAKKVTK